jgi:SAM-dependent methyltransferase
LRSEAGLLAFGPTGRAFPATRRRQWLDANGVPDHSGGSAPDFHRLPITTDLERADGTRYFARKVSEDARSYGAVFDQVADEYDRHRPTYPDGLIDAACEAAGLAAGDRVLEVGCGTGKLSRSLVARGLHVTAIEPGANLTALAARAATGPGELEFVHARFEDARLSIRFPAMFSATAFHWIDPDVSWRKAAGSLTPGGLLALIQYCAVRDEETAEDADALMAALAAAAPAVAEGWPPPRDLETILAGAEDRRGNVSEVWAWVGGEPLARDYAAALFDDAEISVVPITREQTADELNALLRTTSLYHRLAPPQRNALERENRQIEERLGRPIRSSMINVLVTARRSLDSTPR